MKETSRNKTNTSIVIWKRDSAMEECSIQDPNTHVHVTNLLRQLVHLQTNFRQYSCAIPFFNSTTDYKCTFKKIQKRMILVLLINYFPNYNVFILIFTCYSLCIGFSLATSYDTTLLLLWQKIITVCYCN